MMRTGARMLMLALGMAACAAREPQPASTACAEEAPARRGTRGLLYRADARVEAGTPKTLWVEASVTNWGDRPVELQWGAAALRVQAWRSPRRTGTPAWDTQRETDPATGAPVMYPAYARADSVPQGVSVIHREWRRITSVPAFRGDSLPAGTYYLVATLRMLGHSVRLPAGCVRLE